MELKIGDKAPDFTVKLSTGLEFNLSRALKNGPVVVNFIKGTWCPFCRAHMSTLRSWQMGLQEKNAAILVLSTDDLNTIRNWTAKNAVNFLFGSDEDEKVSRSFGVLIPVFGFSRPATFVIDTDQTIRMIHKGIRNDALRVDVDKIVCEIYGPDEELKSTAVKQG